MYVTGRLHCQHTSLSNPIWAFSEKRILTWAATTDSPWILAIDSYLQTLYYAGENSTKPWFTNPCKPETKQSLKKQVLSILKFRSRDLFISPSIKWITVSRVLMVTTKWSTQWCDYFGNVASMARKQTKYIAKYIQVQLKLVVVVVGKTQH